MSTESAPIVRLRVVGKVNPRLRRRMQAACQIMARKSWERGDAWKRTGMVGAFVELYNCFNRLRQLVWEQKKIDPKDRWWRELVENVLVDIRNFTVLMELSMEIGAYHGSYDLGSIQKRPRCKRRLSRRR